MSIHIFLSPPPSDHFIDQCSSSGDQVIFLFRDPRRWTNSAHIDNSLSYSKNVIFASTIFDEFVSFANQLKSNNWINIFSQELAPCQYLLFPLFSHIIRVLDALSLISVCLKYDLPTFFYLGKDNFGSSPTGDGLSDISILTIATNHLISFTGTSDLQIRFISMFDNSNGSQSSYPLDFEHASFVKMTGDFSVPKVHLTTPVSPNLYQNLFDLTHVRDPLNSLRANNITNLANSLLLVNEGPHLWGDIDSYFVSSCDVVYYKMTEVSYSELSINNHLRTDYSRLYSVLQKPCCSELSLFQEFFLFSIPYLISPILYSIDYSVNVFCHDIVNKISCTKPLSLHICDTNYLLAEAFSRSFDNDFSLNLYPHSFSTCSYQQSVNIKPQKVIVNCPFPEGSSICLSAYGVNLHLYYPIPNELIVIPNRLKDLFSACSNSVRNGSSSSSLSAGIFLGSEIESFNILSNPFKTRDYVYSFCELLDDHDVSLDLYIFPKTIFQSKELTQVLFSRYSKNCKIHICMPSHNGIPLQFISNLDFHMYWGNGSANVELALLGVPGLVMNSFQDSIHRARNNYTGYSLDPLNVEDYNSNYLSKLFTASSLYVEGLRQQSVAYQLIHHYLHGTNKSIN